MTGYNVHSTLFFKYLRMTWRIYLLLFSILFIHFLLLSFVQGNRSSVTDMVWIFSELLTVSASIIAFRRSGDYIKLAWLFIVFCGLLMLSGTLIRLYYNLFHHTPGGAFITPYVIAIGNIVLSASFILFNHTGEMSFRMRRQLNLLGLILITVLVISYLINYNVSGGALCAKTSFKATFTGVINISSFIVGSGVYWMSLWRRDIKRKVIYILILTYSLMTFILTSYYYLKKFHSGNWMTGEFIDIAGTLIILLIPVAAWHEVILKNRQQEFYGYKLFYVSRVERIIPVFSIVAIFTVFYFNQYKLDNNLIRSLIFFMIPYGGFLFFFEIYSYRSEDALLSVLSVSPTGIHITDRSFSKTYYVNRSLSDMFHLSEIPPDLITANDISNELKMEIFDSVASEKTLENVEMSLTRTDGTRFDAQCKIIPAKYYSYEIVITWILDITDRKLYEGTLLQQKYTAEITSLYKSELLNNLSNRIQSGYVTMKPDDSAWPDFVLTGMNRRIIELFSFNEDLTGKKLREVFPVPEEWLIILFFEVLNTGVSVKREVYFRGIDKIFLFLIFRASDNEVACLIDDITDSKRKEKELIERERELSSLLENLPGIVYRCENNKEWTMFFVSRGSVDLCGYKPDELVKNGGVSWNDLIHPDDRERVWLEGQDAINRRESFYLDYRIITKDLSLKYVWEKGMGVYDENGGLLFLEGFIFDITKQREAEIFLKENEMRENEMEKARALRQMAGGIAHDLNNRLMGISSYTSLIDLKSKDDSIKKYTDGIQKSIVQSTELIESLLIFARQSDIMTDIFSLHEMLRELILKTIEDFPEVIKINSVFNAEEDRVKGDSRQIYRAVSDIVSNSRDAMPWGGIISISTENRTVKEGPLSELAHDSKKGFIVINISDSGFGIEKENLSRIFDPFYTTKPVGKGRGLGLSAVYGTIQAHNGAITVDSNPGEGTTFSIYLPVA